MNFLHETGAIISATGVPSAYFDGTSGEVLFDQELIKKLHQANPGCIWKFAHTHPLRMNQASQEDHQFLRTWAPFFYPFPVRLSVITSLSREYPKFQEVTYMATLQSKKAWQESGEKFRKIDIIEEDSQPIFPGDLDTDPHGWQTRLTERSYDLI